MQFKEFLFNAVAHNIGEDPAKETIQQNKVNKILIKNALIGFNKASTLTKDYLIQDIDQNIMLFSDKFNKINNDKDKEKEKEKLLKTLASLLDEMSKNNYFWYVIPYDKLYVSDQNQIVFNWFELNEYCVTDQQKIPKHIKTKYQDVISGKLNSGLISYKMLNSDLTQEAFVGFLMKILYPQVPPKFKLPSVKWFNVALTKIGMLPEEKYYIDQILHKPEKNSTCEETVIELFRIKTKSICNPLKKQDLSWEFGFHTEQGRNKKSIQNEDSYTVIPAPDKKSLLFMIADGVSTANIGNGKIISSKIQETLDSQHDTIIKFMEDNSDLSSDAWMKNCKNQLINIFTTINSDCVDILNKELMKTTDSVDAADTENDDKQPMSSTVIIGFVDKNRAIFGHIGDSHVFYINNKNIMRLNEEHNVMADRMEQYIHKHGKQPFQDTKADKHLSRVIPLADYDIDDQKFIEVVDLKNQIEFMEFYPEQNSTIIAATDGLIDCIGSTGNEIKNEEAILQVYSEAASQFTKINDIARTMGRKADKKSGIDNITLIVLKNNQNHFEPHKKKNRPMKKLS